MCTQVDRSHHVYPCTVMEGKSHELYVSEFDMIIIITLIVAKRFNISMCNNMNNNYDQSQLHKKLPLPFLRNNKIVTIVIEK